jgi:Ni,Fe-hydrogenase III component G
MPPHLSPEAPSRKIRKESQYTQEERTVLGKYRAEYKATTTHSQRDTLVRGKIFPDMFNFWYQKEQRLPNETETEERKKVGRGVIRLYVAGKYARICVIGFETIGDPTSQLRLPHPPGNDL